MRSCSRHLGSPKQAAPLPLAELATLQGDEPLAKGGPRWPARSALLASWWLLREIEASNAIRAHISVLEEEKKVDWRLPCSKTDWKALGATRSHSCSCELAASALCPYHNMVAHLAVLDVSPSTPLFPGADGMPATKAGWADTFEELGRRLKLPTTYPNGARCFTGHTARASGAVHLAASQVELWRIQLFGRWGSQVFLQYIKDAPLKQLDQLALETSAHVSLAAAKAQLQDLLRRAQSGLSTVVACPSTDMLADCEASVEPLDPPRPSDPIIVNLNGGKTHRTLLYGDEFHPKEWKTRCAWKFGGPHTNFELSNAMPDAKVACRKCFPELRHQLQSSSSSGTSSSSSESQ